MSEKKLHFVKCKVFEDVQHYDNKLNGLFANVLSELINVNGNANCYFGIKYCFVLEEIIKNIFLDLNASYVLKYSN